MHEFCVSEYIGIIVAISIATEAVIELIKESDISLLLIHSKIIPRYEKNKVWYNYILYKWITCGQCMSVVYSIPGAIFMSTLSTSYILPSFMMFWFTIQRITNWLNSGYKILHRGRVVAIELLSPLINVSNDMAGYDPETLLSAAREREYNRGELGVVNIRNISDIKMMITKLKTESPPNGKSVSINIGDGIFNINTSTGHPSYMQMIKDALKVEDNEPIEMIEINGEKLIPVDVGKNHAIDGFIKQCVGGIRDGNRIKWVLLNGDYFYDPTTDKLTVKDR